MTNDKESKIDENGVEYYAPDLGAAKPLKIPDRSEEDEDNFETRLDDKVIFQRVAKDLYKYPQSAVRELLVNAIGHGARKANEKYGPENKAYVEVKIHPYDRSLVITDVRGMGMTHAQIKSLMSFVGRSGNMDSETAGQFGMGYFSHLKISDSCIVTTLVREPYEYKGKMVRGMSFLNNKGWQWQKINISDEDIDLEEPGTRISLTMNEDTNMRDVIRTVKEVAKYSDILVQFILEDDYDRIPAGIVDLQQIPDLKTIHPKTPDQEVIELDDEDVYFKAVMQKDKWGNMSHEQQKTILLARVPIQVDTVMIPTFSGYVLNIKNERKFMPQPDRERLSAKSEMMLKAKLEELFKSYFSQLKGTTAEEIEAMPFKYPIIFMRQLGIERFFTTATKNFISSLVDHDIKHITFDDVKITTDYSADHNLLQVLAYRKDAIIVYNKALAPILAVSKYCKENNIQPKHFIRIDLLKTSKIAIKLLTEWKIPKIKEYMTEHKIKAKSSSKHISGVTLHYNHGYRESKKITNFDEIDFEKTIWIKGALKPWMKLLSSTHPDFYIAKFIKGVTQYVEENEIGFITDATLYGMKDIDIITSEGKTTISSWYKSNKEMLHSGYSNNKIKTYEASEDDIKNIDRVMSTLTAYDGKAKIGNIEKPVHNAMIILNNKECVVVHDTNGSEIKMPFKNNFLFLISVYDLIKNGTSEITDAINEQIPDIVLPDKKIKNFTQLYSTSPFYTDPIDHYIYEDTYDLISGFEHWKAQDLDIKDYFGIPNKYKSRYDWRDNFPTMKLVMELINENVKNDDVCQMIFKGIHKSNHDYFCRAIGFASYVTTPRTPAQLAEVKNKIKPFIVGITKQIPEIDSKNQFDIFVKTRHALNNLNDVLKTPTKFPWIDKSRMDIVVSIINSIQKVIGDVNSRISIKGKFSEFINEFLKGSQSEVVETDNTITVKCNPTFALQVKNMIELHSNTGLSQIKPSGDKIMMVFRLYDTNNVISSGDDDDGIKSYEMSNKCQCGCNNTSTLKITKNTSNDYDDDD